MSAVLAPPEHREYRGGMSEQPDQLLFTYGSLQDAEVQLDTFGRLVVSQPATLPGYTIDYIEIDDARLSDVAGPSVHPVLRHTGNALDKVVGTVVDREQKGRDLLRFAHEGGIEPQWTVAVGDGANDLGMFDAAGLSVAYCAKPVTAAAADVAIGFPRLDAVAAFAFPSF